jgi:hypothetical protein
VSFMVPGVISLPRIMVRLRARWVIGEGFTGRPAMLARYRSAGLSTPRIPGSISDYNAGPGRGYRLGAMRTRSRRRVWALRPRGSHTGMIWSSPGLAGIS